MLSNVLLSAYKFLGLKKRWKYEYSQNSGEYQVQLPKFLWSVLELFFAHFERGVYLALVTNFKKIPDATFVQLI